MRFRLTLIQYAEKFGVTKAAIKYKTNCQYICCWKNRYDGSNAVMPDLFPVSAASYVNKTCFL